MLIKKIKETTLTMNVQSQRRHQDTEKCQRDENLAENYKILKQTYFKSVRQYDTTHSCMKYEGIC